VSGSRRQRTLASREASIHILLAVPEARHGSTTWRAFSWPRWSRGPDGLTGASCAGYFCWCAPALELCSYLDRHDCRRRLAVAMGPARGLECGEPFFLSRRQAISDMLVSMSSKSLAILASMFLGYCAILAVVGVIRDVSRYEPARAIVGDAPSPLQIAAPLLSPSAN
jgi:hypothetical protein